MKRNTTKFKIFIVILLSIFYVCSYSSLYARYIYEGWNLNDQNDLDYYNSQVQALKDEISRIKNDSSMSQEDKQKELKKFDEDIKILKDNYSNYSVSNDASNQYNSALNETGDFWEQAQNWYNGGDLGSSIDSVRNGPAGKVITEFSNMVNLIGTTVIVLATIFLGVKYIYGSVEAKADVKEGLFNLLIACVFFFGWNSIWTVLFARNSLIFVKDNLNSTIAQIFNTLTKIANVLAIGGVIFIGVKYVLSGAKGKSELKLKSTNFLIGIVMAFCAVGLLTYISNIINSAFAS